MNSHSDVNQDTSVSPHAAAGKILAAQREKLGMSIAECSEVLKITNTKLIALEKGDSKPFPSEVFLRGYIKSYAKLLHLSEDEVMQHYDVKSASGGQDSAVKFKKSNSQSPGRWWIPYIVGFVIVVLWFLLSDFLGLTQKEQTPDSKPKTSLLIPEVVVEIKSQEENSDNNEQQDLPEDNDVSEPNSNSVVNIEADDGAENTEKDIIETINSEVLQDDSVQVESTNLAVESVNNSETIQEPTVVDNSENNAELTNSITVNTSEQDSNENSVVVSGKNRLYFTFDEECWVRIVDANEQVLISSLREARSDLSVVGQAPFSVLIGNIQGTSLYYEGELIPLVGSLDGRTLRLTLGE